MAQPVLILVGGFLGAGKTTWLSRAGLGLQERGLSAGLITNDQAGQLVDTEQLMEGGFRVEEVTGGCFCCRFEDLVSATERLAQPGMPDVVLGEPVGSCTDLTATVLRPVQKYFPERFRVAPFTVMADAQRLCDLRDGRAKDVFPHSVLYIYGKQLEEADLILLNKTDLLPPAEVDRLKAWVASAYPHARVLTVCAQRGEGVREWLDEVLATGRPAGARAVMVDYDLYAEGEAEMGWLNASLSLEGAPADWRVWCEVLLREIQQRCVALKAEIGHVKLFLLPSGGSVVGNVTSSAAQPFVLAHGDLSASGRVRLVLNARVCLAPEKLRTLAEAAWTAQLSGGMTAVVESLEFFRPGRPQPTHRLDAASCPIPR
jgi:Ni2+-binding GTPase involved in maturation of urease and hydrogenase